jgi:hypothetical protein
VLGGALVEWRCFFDPREYSIWWAHGSKCSKHHQLDQTPSNQRSRSAKVVFICMEWRNMVEYLGTSGDHTVVERPHTSKWALLFTYGCWSHYHGEVWVVLECWSVVALISYRLCVHQSLYMVHLPSREDTTCI